MITYLTQAPDTITPSTVFWITLGATLAGAFGLLWALRLLLQPILLAGQALNCYLTNGEILPLPGDLHDEAGRMMRDVGSAIRTFTENHQRLEKSAETDFLTGLLNRCGADERLQQNLHNQSITGKPLYVAILDIDHFKQLNDGFGHGFGDLALQNLGHTLEQALPEEGAWAARWGGEKFLLAWQGGTAGAESPEAVRESLDKIRRTLPAVDTGANKMLPLTAGIRLTEACAGEPAETALARADVALYIAKQNGRDQTCSMNLMLKSGGLATDSIWLSSDFRGGERYERRSGTCTGSETP